MQKTPLYDEHLKLKAKMIPFAGHIMPLQYSSIRKEHHCVRNYVGLFDVSHMGELRLQGRTALLSLQWMTSNNLDKLDKGMAQYSLLTNFHGGIVDDILIYCIEKPTDYLVCVNAINKDKDLQWMMQNKKEDTHIIDESTHWSQIAIQGPYALQLADQVFHQEKISLLKPFSFISWKDAFIARTGYTGEKGLEVFIPNADVKQLWIQLLEAGRNLQVAPIGLGARDCLRMEMKYSLYGHEITDQTNPIEAGLGWAVKFKKGDFIGRDAILKVKQEGTSRQLIGFKVLEQGGIPRQGYQIKSLKGDVTIGYVTSGTLSPTLGWPIGIGYVPSELASVGSQFQVAIRKHLVKAEVVKTPFIH